MSDDRYEIGCINSHIPGDMRYSDRLAVFVRENGDVEIELSETGAAGGMDSFNGSTNAHVTFSRRLKHKEATPKAIASALDAAMNTSGCTIKRYGKPTKNFRWSPEGYGGMHAWGYSQKTIEDVFKMYNAPAGADE